MLTVSSTLRVGWTRGLTLRVNGEMKKFLKVFFIILVLASLGFYLAFFSLGQLKQTRDEGMLPTIEYKQYFWLEFISYRFTTPKRGDIVIYSTPGATNKDSFWQQLAGRIIAVPGETVQIKEGRVFVNGLVLGEPYITKGASEDTPRPGRLEDEVKLSGDSYIVLADNRVQGVDSRSLGPITRADIVGKAHFF